MQRMKGMHQLLLLLLLLTFIVPVKMTPTGCTYTSGLALCDYSTWTAPMSDSDLSGAVGAITFTNVDGTFPTNGLSGMAGSNSYVGSKQLTFDCGYGTYNTLGLTSDSLGSNLNWITMISITDCYNMVFADNALSIFTAVDTLAIQDGNFSSISSTALSGMTALATFNLYAGFPTSGVHSGLLSGLTAITSMDINGASLQSVPSDMFEDQKDVTTFNFINTGLATIPDGLFLPLLSLTTFSDTTNSWECTCDLLWYAEWLLDRGHTTTCGSPTTLAGYTLSRAVKSLECSTTSTPYTLDPVFYYGTIVGICITAVLVLVAVAALVLIFNKVNKMKKLKKDIEKAIQDKPATSKEGAQNGSMNNASKAWTSQVTPTDSKVKGRVQTPVKSISNTLTF